MSNYIISPGSTIILLAESCHNLVERFTPIVREILQYATPIRIIGIFVGFELGSQHIDDKGLFSETHFFAESESAVSVIKMVSHNLLITFIDHNSTVHDSRLYDTARSSTYTKAYVLRNVINLNKYLTTGIDDSVVIRSQVSRVRKENVTIQIKLLLLHLLTAAIVYPAKLLQRLIPERRDTKKRILFIKLDVLGDMIVTLPYLVALREAFPNAELTVLASGRGGAILTEQNCLYEHGLFDHLLTWDAPWHIKFPKILGLAELCELLRRLPFFWKQRYDLVIQPVNFGTGIIFAVLTFGKRVVAIIDSRLPLALEIRSFVSDPVELRQERIYHLGDFSDLVLSRLGVTTDLAAQGLLISDQARGKVEQLLVEQGFRKECKLVLFNIGAGHPLRVWGASKFARLAEGVGARHEVMIVLTGSKQEGEMALEIGKQSDFPVVNSAGFLSLNELVALASIADLMVTVDTGIMHLAAALQTPLVAIFGAGLVDYCKPLSLNHLIVKEELGCSGCADRCFVSDTPPCLERVTVEKVLEAVEKMLQSKTAGDLPDV
jgi:ADP-heptose:LPS heptosyltransferase